MVQKLRDHHQRMLEKKSFVAKCWSGDERNVRTTGRKGILMGMEVACTTRSTIEMDVMSGRLMDETIVKRKMARNTGRLAGTARHHLLLDVIKFVDLAQTHLADRQIRETTAAMATVRTARTETAVPPPATSHTNALVTAKPASSLPMKGL